MFPHTITIFHHSVVNGTDVYSRTEVPGCYLTKTASRAGSGKGTEKTDSYMVVASPEATTLYGNTWRVFTGDRIVKSDALFGSIPSFAGVAVAGSTVCGETAYGASLYQDIRSWKDLPDNVMIVKAIEENICGSSVDNITLIG